jgi:hypothetical protein
MQFTLLLHLFVAALGQLVQGALAVNERLLIQIPSFDGMSTFTDA